MDVAEMLTVAPVVPVLVIEDAATAVPLARALCAGGLRLLEVTLRTPAALDAIERIAGEVEEAVVGAGTVLTPADCEKARQAGARFAVSPGLTAALMRQEALPLLPGVATASEVMAASEAGFRHFKFFPAVPAGGIGWLKGIAGPFPDIRFCPTGGIDVTLARDFLALPNVACVGGSWVAPAAAIRHGDWERIRVLSAAAAALREI